LKAGFDLRANEQSPATEGVHHHHVDPGHHEIGTSDHQTDSDWVGEADESEECRRVVHQRVETGQLRDDHQATSADKSAEVGWVGVKHLDLLPAGCGACYLFGFLTSSSNESCLCANLLGSGTGVDLLKDHLGLLELTVIDELSRAFGAEWKEACQQNSGHPTKTDHVSPSIGHVSKSSSNTIRDDLSASNGHVVKTNHATAHLARSDLGNIERNNHSGGTDTEANDQASDAHLGNGVGCGLEYCACRKKRASSINGTLATLE
jgi:hypothetical protein